MSQLSKEEIEWLAEKCKQSFAFFCQVTMSPDWFDEVFHVDFCNFLQRDCRGQVGVLPRGFLKTTIGSVRYPLWRAINKPTIRCLLTSNIADNSRKTVNSIRMLLENNKLIQTLFPDLIPVFSKVRWSDTCACVNRSEDFREGTFEAAGVGTNIISRHYDLIIEDDTVSPTKDDMTGEELLPNKDDIEKAIGFHRLTLPLLVDYNTSKRIVLATRWGADDVISYVEENEKNFEVFDRPAYNAEGLPLYKRYPITLLDEYKMLLGNFFFSSLYLNSPLQSEQMKFRPIWTKYFEGDAPEGLTVVVWDPADAPTGRREQDYSGFTVATHTSSGMYVLHTERKRLTEKQGIEECFALADLYQATLIRVEEDRYANLKFAFKDAMERVKKYYSIDAVKTRGRSKEARIMALAPLFEAGTIYLRKGMRDLENEMYSFPNGKHDDLLDSLAWQLPSYRRVEGIKPKGEKKGRMLPIFEEMFETLTIRSSSRSGCHF